jgi:hypothetical protein
LNLGFVVAFKTNSSVSPLIVTGAVDNSQGWISVEKNDFSSVNINFNYSNSFVPLFIVLANVSFTIINSVITGSDVNTNYVFHFSKGYEVKFEKVKFSGFKSKNTSNSSVIFCNDVALFSISQSSFESVRYEFIVDIVFLFHTFFFKVVVAMVRY